MNKLVLGFCALLIAFIVQSVTPAYAAMDDYVHNLATVSDGTSIAIVWSHPDDGTPIPADLYYSIQRDGKAIATIRQEPITYGKYHVSPLLTQFIDKDVNTGSAHHYQVTAHTGGAAYLATAETSPYSSKDNSLPEIIFKSKNNEDIQDLQPLLQQYIKPYLVDWYPKIANYLIGTSYSIPRTITVYLDSSHDGIAYTSNGAIYANPSYIRKNPADSAGMLLHESVHLIQQAKDYTGASSWLVEGTADWFRDFFTRERRPTVITESSKKTDGYGTSAAFLQWVMDSRQKPQLLRDLTVQNHTQPYSETYFQQIAGDTSDTLWAGFYTEKLHKTPPVSQSSDWQPVSRGDSISVLVAQFMTGFVLLGIAVVAMTIYKSIEADKSRHPVDKANSAQPGHDIQNVDNNDGTYPKLFK